jgi:hypothetical protein
MPTELHDWLETPPKRKEAVVKQIASELLVPDFFLFAQKPLLPPASIADFRLSRPVPRPYQRDTLKAIDLAKSIQLDAGKRTTFKSQNRLCKHVPSSLGPQKAASKLRRLFKITDDLQSEFGDARLFYAHVRNCVEQFETFVFQFSFSTDDGIGFAVTSDKSFDAIVINTLNQTYPRRLFTLGHEIYHCILNETGISDPEVIKSRSKKNGFMSKGLVWSVV